MSLLMNEVIQAIQVKLKVMSAQLINYKRWILWAKLSANNKSSVWTHSTNFTFALRSDVSIRKQNIRLIIMSQVN